MKPQDKLAKLVNRAEKAERDMIRAFNRWQKATKAATALSLRLHKRNLKGIGGEYHLDDLARSIDNP